MKNWRSDVDDAQPLFATIRDGKAISVCASVRKAHGLHEAGVETLPEARRQGGARRAVASWARAVIDRGDMPLYSTSWDNLASQGVARSLGLEMFAVDYWLK